jgi:hypothetical protein
VVGVPVPVPVGKEPVLVGLIRSGLTVLLKEVVADGVERSSWTVEVTVVVVVMVVVVSGMVAVVSVAPTVLMSVVTVWLWTLIKVEVTVLTT